MATGGRKSLAKTREPLKIYLTPRQRQAIEIIAEDSGKSLSQVIADAVDRAMEARWGLIGPRLPADVLPGTDRVRRPAAPKRQHTEGARAVVPPAAGPVSAPTHDIAAAAPERGSALEVAQRIRRMKTREEHWAALITELAPLCDTEALRDRYFELVDQFLCDNRVPASCFPRHLPLDRQALHRWADAGGVEALDALVAPLELDATDRATFDAVKAEIIAADSSEPS